MNKKIYALIPARSGSKGLVDKNIKIYKGQPLLVHSINIALKCSMINETFITTDSEKYEKIGLENGAKSLGLRPKNISDDLSSDLDVFQYFVKTLKEKNMEIPDIIIHLRPTYPNRNLELLNDCINCFKENYDNYDSLRTVILINKLPYKMYHIENNNLIPIIKEYKNLKEPFNQARQCFPNTYLHNGCIDILKTDNINNNNISGKNIFPYIMDEKENDDIDNINDFINSEKKSN